MSNRCKLQDRKLSEIATRTMNTEQTGCANQKRLEKKVAKNVVGSSLSEPRYTLLCGKEREGGGKQICNRPTLKVANSYNDALTL